MTDDTVVIRKNPATLAYVFWVSGVRRGDHAALTAEGTTLGRGRESDVLVDDPTVSEEHARIRREGEAWYLYDLASANTTEVAGEAVFRHRLADGDRLTLGETHLAFRVVP